MFFLIAPGAGERIWGVWPPLVRVATWCDCFLKVVFFVPKKNKGKPRGTPQNGPLPGQACTPTSRPGDP